jgi:adenylate cyclase
MFTDVVGFSRQMGSNETRTLRLLGLHNQTIRQAVAEHHGVVIKTIGDAFLVDFPSVVHAVQSAQQIQAQFRVHNTDKEKAEQIHVRIGIHSGDIVQRDGDVFGDGVNIASRLQGLAEPDTICISQKVYEEVEKKLSLGTAISLGRPKLKNIAQRFRVYTLLSGPPKGLRQTLRMQRLKLSRRVGTVVSVFVLVSVLLLGGIVILLYPSLPTFIIQEAQPPSLPLPDKPSIVVLPFVNMSGDPGQEYFSDGITEDITADLSKLSGFFVIARNSAFTYKGKAVKVQEVSREMGVRYVLEGSVRKAGEQVRVTAQLIDGPSGGHVWSERYDRPLKDIFAVQDEITERIVVALGAKVVEAEMARVKRIPTESLAAYDFFLRGMEFALRAQEETNKEANIQAQQMCEKAIELDPQYARAYAGLGWTYWNEWAFQWSQDPQTLGRAEELARKALALDDTLSIARLLLSAVYQLKNRRELALAEAERAIALAPNNADAHGTLAGILNSLERPMEAIRAAEQAMRLHPRARFWFPWHLGRAYSLLGRYEEAIAALQQALLGNPNSLFPYLDLVGTYVEAWLSQQRQDPRTLEQALEAAQQAVTVDTSSPWAHLTLGWAYLLKKQYDQAEVEVNKGLALNPGIAAIAPAFVAELLNWVGRPEEAIRMMEQALHSDPRPPTLYLFPLGQAYYLTGRAEEAIEPLQRFLRVYPHRVDVHVLLAAVYSEMGREHEARAEAAEVLRLNPQYSLEVMRQRWPSKDPAQLERLLATLRKAGLK